MLATRTAGLCRLVIIGTAAALFACGGGGGAGAPAGPSFVASPASLNFSALANAGAPAGQFVTVTTSGISSGTLFFRVTIPGGLVASISSVTVTGPSSGLAAVNVVAPSTLGPGVHTGSISIVACTTDINCSGPLLGGSPQTIGVNYTITPSLQGDAVAHHVVSSGAPGEVVIRGQGLSSLTGVAFGGNSATFTQISTTEIRANYPALLADTYPVQLQNASGPLAFSGSLVVVDPPAFSATALTYPASPGNFRSVVYDAVRKAILVATDTQILRYAFSASAWQAPAQQAVANLTDISLSIDGASLLTLTTDSLKQLDPVTLATNGTTPGQITMAPLLSFERLAVANDGIALVTNHDFGVFLYTTKSPAFYIADNGPNAFGALPATSDNGSLVAFIQGQLSPAPLTLKYLGSSGLLSPTSVHLNRISVNLLDLDPRPAVDRSGTRIAFNSSAGDFTGIVVFDQNMNLIGALPGTTAAVAFAPNPAGAAVRAYTLDSCKVRAFGLTTDVNGNFAEILTTPYPITLGACPGNHPRIVMTPDGGNAILASDTQVVIVPTP